MHLLKLEILYRRNDCTRTSVQFVAKIKRSEFMSISRSCSLVHFVMLNGSMRASVVNCLRMCVLHRFLGFILLFFFFFFSCYTFCMSLVVLMLRISFDVDDYVLLSFLCIFRSTCGKKRKRNRSEIHFFPRKSSLLVFVSFS